MVEINKESITALIKESITRINNGISKTLTARKSNEVPPQDTRHLTDTRTRVSTLLEYSLSYELNHVLIEKNTDHSISNVLWNVFPDLVIRDINFNNVAGLEVKALHSAAEEKSANLHTPISLIRKDKDFIIILAWGWRRIKTDLADITYPYIHDVGIFDAWLIAKMRDTTWLINSNNRIKGIDISTPIISAGNGMYKAEEGNLGKLMRIHMSSQTSNKVPYYEEVKSEALAYELFKNRILFLGLNETILDISESINGVVTYSEATDYLPTIATVIGCVSYPKSKIHFVVGVKRSNVEWSEIIETLDENEIIIHLGTKLDWKVIKHSGTWTVLSSGKKPDIELEKICNSILNH